MSIAAGTLTDWGPDSGGRLKGVTITKPIVIGNSARYFGKKREEDGHTHSWTVYIKPYYNEDYSLFIKKVNFKLHDSYANPNRVVLKPPYEVTETGWGEFEITIKIYFADPNERAVTVYHILKLFSPGSDPSTPVVKKVLTSEFYDEVVFHEPTLLMKNLLDNLRPLSTSGYRHEVDFEEKKRSSLAAVVEGRNKVKSEIKDMREKLKIANDTIAALKEAVASVQKGNAEGTQTPLKAPATPIADPSSSKASV